MGIGTSILLIAIGAILYFAVEVDVSGLQLSTVGIILMIVGVIGLIISLVFMSQARGRGATVVEDRPVVRERDVY